MNFEAYLGSIPNLHTWDGGKTWVTGGFADHQLREFRRLVDLCGGENATILETGAGNSTITFLYAKPKKIISVDPDPELADRITTFCREHEIDSSRLDFRVGRSEWVLPDLAKTDLEIDLALIDGCHSWPAVFVDFCYVYVMLRVGGLFLLDDVQLYSVGELARLLESEPARFAMEKKIGKTTVFKKLMDEQFLPEWDFQPYIVERSK